MADELTVYLDHLIRRENLRYQRPIKAGEVLGERLADRMELKELRNEARSRKLRKPDFQRATNAWTSEDCRSLLETVINKQIVPSLIMWQNPENLLDYVLDGAHRVSVVLAWLTDDWGEKAISQSDFYGTDEDRERISFAARKTRELVDATIGNIRTYQDAQATFDRIVEAGDSPQAKMDKKEFDRARFYERLERGYVHFPVLWVTGDYRDAEASFLKINKSGKQLYEWERTLVENRDSSFARIIMSVAFPQTSKRYWPEKVEEEHINENLLKQRVDNILEAIQTVHTRLLTPAPRYPIQSVNQPLLVPPATEKKPFWIGEFLTVVEGRKGTLSETLALLERDKSESADVITRNAEALLNDANLALDHIVGENSRSLSLVPTIYFYSDGGAPLRGFLYGFLYWLLAGEEEDINQRKRIFSAFRKPFETIILSEKKDLTVRFGRGLGSGSEITGQWAKYLNDLLELICKSKGDLQTEAFKTGYAKIVQSLPKSKVAKGDSDEIAGRVFNNRQKSTLILKSIHEGLAECSICAGALDLTRYLQHDHIIDHAEGGTTSSTNQGLAHPFCNNNKKEIQAILNFNGIKLPVFEPNESSHIGQQLKLFTDEYFSE